MYIFVLNEQQSTNKINRPHKWKNGWFVYHIFFKPSFCQKVQNLFIYERAKKACMTGGQGSNLKSWIVSQARRRLGAKEHVR